MGSNYGKIERGISGTTFLKLSLFLGGEICVEKLQVNPNRE